MNNTEQQIREEYWKQFPDPMEEKYGEGFALYCSNCSKGQGAEERVNFFLTQRRSELQQLLQEIQSRKTDLNGDYGDGKNAALESIASLIKRRLE